MDLVLEPVSRAVDRSRSTFGSLSPAARGLPPNTVGAAMCPQIPKQGDFLREHLPSGRPLQSCFPQARSCFCVNHQAVRFSAHGSGLTCTPPQLGRAQQTSRQSTALPVFPPRYRIPCILLPEIEIQWPARTGNVRRRHLARASLKLQPS